MLCRSSRAIQEEDMNKKARSGNRSQAKAGRLSFNRETIRILSVAESRAIVGGRNCAPAESCGGDSCPESVCTITLDRTI